MNYDPRFAAVCGDARLPSHKSGSPIKKQLGESAQEVCAESDAGTLCEPMTSSLSSDPISLAAEPPPAHAWRKSAGTLVAHKGSHNFVQRD